MPQPLAELIELACLWEATAPKPGNVHPGASFADLKYSDFVASAAAASPWLAQAAQFGVGGAVERAIEATRRVTSSNTNLGIVLLIAPLAAAPPDRSLSAGIGAVLRGLTVVDTAAVYRAIRAAHPGWLGAVDAEDVAGEPTLNLVAAMQLAAERDRVARQYVTNFADVLGTAQRELEHWLSLAEGDCAQTLVGLHLSLLARIPDTLIVRKCGAEMAREASERARHVLARSDLRQTGEPSPEPPPREGGGERGRNALPEGELRLFDDWLRADGHRRNPGTTADLVAATVFAHLRECERLGRDSPFQQRPATN